ncbi:MAG: hypothetical protein A2X32_02295 [Elusimicrobia bacterium GWC2_64_44]|nr:MAG: hypothetical protein A2X32_02295 [Elusimicrobia bacterium GWC2_64_44]
MQVIGRIPSGRGLSDVYTELVEPFQRFEPICPLPRKSCEFIFDFLFFVDQLGLFGHILGLIYSALQHQVQQLAQLVCKDNQLISQILGGSFPGLGRL